MIWRNLNWVRVGCDIRQCPRVECGIDCADALHNSAGHGRPKSQGILAQSQFDKMQFRIVTVPLLMVTAPITVVLFGFEAKVQS